MANHIIDMSKRWSSLFGMRALNEHTAFADEVVRLAASGVTFAVVPGTDGPDTLTDTAGDDLIIAGGGDDTVRIINGGIDAADGGADNDLLEIDYSGLGQPIILSTTSDGIAGASGTVTAAGIQRLTFTGFERLQIATGTGDDTIRGFAGGSLVRSGSGLDRFVTDLAILTGVNDVDLGDGSDVVEVTNGTGQIRLTFTSAGVGNGNALDTATDGLLNVRFQREDATGALTGPISRYDDEGITFIATAGQTFDVRDTGGAARGDQFEVVALGTMGDDTMTAVQAGRAYYFNGGMGNDTITGGTANDFLVGGAGTDILSGGDGNDSFIGGAGNDTITGGIGNDTAIFNVATDGLDTVDLGVGADIVQASGVTGQVRLTFTSAGVGNGNGLDTTTDSLLNVRLQAEDAFGTLTGSISRFDDEGITFIASAGMTFDVRDTGGAERGNQFEVVALGTSADDTMTAVQGARPYYFNGGAGNDTITGGTADDFLVGGAGNDTLDGGAGFDTLLGGGGDDIFIVGEGLNPNAVVVNYDYFRVANGARSLAPDIVAPGVGASSLNLVGTFGGSPFDNHYYVSGWGAAVDPTKYFELTLTPGSSPIDLSAVTFGMEKAGGAAGSTAGWVLRSSADNYTANLGSGSVADDATTAFTVDLSAFAIVTTPVTFRWYLTTSDPASVWGFANHQSPGSGAGIEAPGQDLFFTGAVVVPDVVVEAANGGTDEVRTALSNYTLTAEVENLTYTGTAAGTFRGNAVNNRITASEQDDFIDLRDGGNDNVSGLGGNDGFYFGAAYTSADVVDGGAGTRDQIGLQGTYAAGSTLGSLVGVEQVVLLAGNDNRFGGGTGANFSYNLTANAGTIVSNNTLNIQANTLRAGENFTFNGAASGINFVLSGGLGIDTLTGGTGNDGFVFGQGRFGTSDVVNGGAGAFDQLALQGTHTLTFGAAQLSGLEFIVLLTATDTRFGAGGGAAAYNLTMNDGNVAAGQQLVIQGNVLRAGETLVFNGAAETDGTFRIFSGAANDTLTGGQGADQIFAGAGNDIITGGLGADQLTGAAGNDTFRYNVAGDSTNAARDQIRDFATGDLIDLTGLAANNGLGGFRFIGGNLATGAGQLQVIQNGNQATVNVYINADDVADLVINVTVADGHTLTDADFLGDSQPLPAEPIGKLSYADHFDGALPELQSIHSPYDLLHINPTTDLLV